MSEACRLQMYKRAHGIWDMTFTPSKGEDVYWFGTGTMCAQKEQAMEFVLSDKAEDPSLW